MPLLFLLYVFYSNVGWLVNFLKWANLLGLLELHLAHPKMLVTACANQLLGNLSYKCLIALFYKKTEE